MKKTFLFVLVFVILIATSAQQVNFIKYTQYDGLVANPVRCIYQDSKGFIWIGTFEGLSRYDGYRFTNYTNTNGLSHNFINYLFEIDNKLFIAENNGAIDVIENSSIQKGFMLSSAVNSIIPYKNRLLITTDTSGFYEYKNDTIIQAAQEKTGLALGHFVEYNDSLIVSDGIDNNIFVFTKDLNIYSAFLGANIYFYSTVKDSKKRIWICSSGGLKLLQLPEKKGQPITFAPLPPEFNIPALHSQVTSIIEEKDGSFWIGTMKGLVHLFPGGDFKIYNEKDGLPSAAISTIYRDRENNLWIGTALGLAKWVSRNNVIFYNTENKDFKNDVLSLHLLPNKKILLNTTHGLQQFYPGTKGFKNMKPAPLKSYVPIEGSFPTLVHYADNVGILDETKNTITAIETLEKVIEDVYSGCQHSSGIIFLASGNGLYAVKKSSVQKVLPHRITCLQVDDAGNIWAGSWQSGLFRISIKQIGDSIAYTWKDFTNLTGQKEIRSLYKDSKKNIWVGTRYVGAFCLTSKGNENFDVQHFNRQSGLMSDWVKSFAETKTGDMWIGTYLGLDKLVKQSIGYRVFNFSKATNFFAQIENMITPGNDTWICVANTGLAYFEDEAMHENLPLQASVLSVSLGVLENKLTIISPKEKISLNPNQNAARFEFSALGFINEKQVMYSYRLKGSSDTTWSKPENIHEASYVSLPPGHYTFEVKTIGWNSEDGTPTAFSFFISTPFWKQWWFIGLGVLAIAIFLYALYQYRIHQLLRLQTVRNNIATDLHDDIGSTLTNISILSELSSKHLSQPEKAQPFLQRISEEVQASSQAMDDIIWSVNSHNDSLQEIIARMRRYAAELFDNSETDCHLKLDENAGNKKLSMEQRRDVYLIYKEALNNIHKHAAAANVWIEVIQSHNQLYIKIKDDGRGFNPDQLTHRNGLKNLTTRVEKWRGRIHIHSAETKGTVIEVKIPLKE